MWWGVPLRKKHSGNRESVHFFVEKQNLRATLITSVSPSTGERRRPLGAVSPAPALQAWDAALCQGDPGIHRQPDPASVLERVHSQARHCQRPGRHPPHTRRLPQQSHLQVRIGTAAVLRFCAILPIEWELEKQSECADPPLAGTCRERSELSSF